MNYNKICILVIFNNPIRLSNKKHTYWKEKSYWKIIGVQKQLPIRFGTGLKRVEKVKYPTTLTWTSSL